MPAAVAEIFHALTIAAVRRETDEAISVALIVPPDLRDTFAFKPGQFIGVRATIDGIEVRRSYSICAAPDEPDLRIAIKRVAGGTFSTWAAATLAPGMPLEVLSPSGRFVLPPGDGSVRHILALAAGSGITPVFAIVSHALAREPDCRVTLIYGNRTTDRIIFREQLEDLKDRFMGRFVLVNVLSRNEESDAPLFEGRISAEKVAALAGQVFRAADIVHAFVCGPGSMIRDVRNTLAGLGVPRDRIYQEVFASPGVPRAADRRVTSSTQVGRPVATLPETDFEVIAVLDGARHRFAAKPGEAIIDAALRAGLRVPYACKGGMCCTCRAKLVEGQAPMTLNYSLEAWEIEKGFVLTCQAVPASPRVVVDYDQM